MKKIRAWLIALIREAISAELSERLSESGAKLSRIEANFANIAVRVKEKREEQKIENPRAPLRGGWVAIKNKLESE